MLVLVTGGGGFLGSAICRMLRARGDEVRSINRREYPLLDQIGVKPFRGDVSDASAVLQAAKDCDLVIHTAAKAGVWGPYQEYYQANVLGTQNVLQACHSHGIGKLVYTSSPSVVHSGGDVEGLNESAPYPEHFETHYPKTKAQAEKMVLDANNEELCTVALRPHLIWGPGDNHLVPRILSRAKSGRLRRVGDGSNVVDTVYVDNAASAHLLAADKLEPGSAICGKAYFIAQDEPVKLWDLVDKILQADGQSPLKKTISAKAAYAVGGVLEAVYKTLRLKSEPPMTRFVAQQLSTSHWFDLTAAKRDLGYQPSVTIEEGLARLHEHLQTQKA